MPIYGYACKNCGHTLNALQKIADEPLVDCPECNTSDLKRQLSAPRFRLKGQGWYETDFKKDNQRNIAGEKDASKPDTKPGDKADAKPDTKVEKKADASSTPKTTAKVSGDKAGTG